MKEGKKKEKRLKELDDILKEINEIYQPIKDSLDEKLEAMENAELEAMEKGKVDSIRGKRGRDGEEESAATLLGNTSRAEEGDAAPTAGGDGGGSSSIDFAAIPKHDAKAMLDKKTYKKWKQWYKEKREQKKQSRRRVEEEALTVLSILRDWRHSCGQNFDDGSYRVSCLLHLSLPAEKRGQYRHKIGEAIDLLLGVLTHDASESVSAGYALSLVSDLMSIDRDDRRLTLAMQMLGQPKRFKSSARLIAAKLLNNCYVERLIESPVSALNNYCVAFQHLEKTVAPILKKRNKKREALPHKRYRKDELDEWYPAVVSGCLLTLLLCVRALDLPQQFHTHMRQLILDKAVALVVKSLPYIKHDCGVLYVFVKALLDGALGPVKPFRAELRNVLKRVVNEQMTTPSRGKLSNKLILACASLEAFGDQPVCLLDSFSPSQLEIGKLLDSQLAEVAGDDGLYREDINLALGLVMPMGASQDWTPTLTWRAVVVNDENPNYDIRDCGEIIKHLVQNPTHPVWACAAFYDNKGSPALSNQEEVIDHLKGVLEELE